jgi:general secretion pathway protein E
MSTNRLAPSDSGTKNGAGHLIQGRATIGRTHRQDSGHAHETTGDVPASDDLAAWAERLEVPVLSTLSGRTAAASFVKQIPIGFARRNLVLGLAGNDDQSLDVAIANISRWQVLDVISRHLDRDVNPILVPDTEVLAAVNRAYEQKSDEAQSLVSGMEREEIIRELEASVSCEDLLDSSGRPPVIKLVNSILFEAIRARASDVHVQPLEDALIIRQRIDGVLLDALSVPKDFQDEVISRLKVLGKMNIAEKRLPQDGRASVQVGDRLIDLRIASLPTSYGERVVVRFLDKSSRLYTLTELGMDDDTLSRFRRLIKREHGMILVTGPTGSGKSTTLYAALQEINSKDLNVLTLEDPIEYQLKGISQTQVNEKKGMTFAKGLRNILRQDPDIIMVGEIRDSETAEMAIQSSLTGHLVFSTLHTNDAASAITRLLDLGIEPFLVASSVVAVVAQRLVRRICLECRESQSSDNGYSGSFSGIAETFRGRGCESCRYTGYAGRIGLFELMEVTDSIRDLIQKRANAAQIRDEAIRLGMRLLADDGKRRVQNGTTTIEEVIRVTTEARV